MGGLRGTTLRAVRGKLRALWRVKTNVEQAWRIVIPFWGCAPV